MGSHPEDRFPHIPLQEWVYRAVVAIVVVVLILAFFAMLWDAFWRWKAPILPGPIF